MLTIKADRTASVLRAIKSLTMSQVLVGVPDSTAERDPDPEDPQPLSNAAIAYIHEFGAPEANIPARPFLVPGVEGAEEKIVKRYQGGAKAVLDGRLDDINAVHQAVGLETAAAVQLKITDGPFAALSDVTIERRKAAGRTGTMPLIDTGQLRRAITFVVRPSKG